MLLAVPQRARARLTRLRWPSTRTGALYVRSELTFEQDWIGHGWPAPALITFRLTPLSDGTLVELLHHGFERFGPDAAENHRGFEGGWGTTQLDALFHRVQP